MADTFASYDTGKESPADNAITVTASDVTVLDTSRALYVGGTGNVAVIMKGGQSVIFVAVPAGSVLPIRVTQVLATGTTASSILSIY